LQKITDCYGKAEYVKTDVSKPTEVEALIKKIIKMYDRLYDAYNSDGILGDAVSVTNLSEEN
jgi:hypothetical protein